MFLTGIPIGIVRSAIASKICVITEENKKYKSIIKKKKRKKKLSLTKVKLKSIKVLISKGLFDSNISHGEIDLLNIVLKEFDGMKEEIKNSNEK